MTICVSRRKVKACVKVSHLKSGKTSICRVRHIKSGMLLSQETTSKDVMMEMRVAKKTQQILIKLLKPT